MFDVNYGALYHMNLNLCTYVRQSHALNGGVSWNDWCLRVMRLKVNQQLLMTTLWVMQRHWVGNVKLTKVKYVQKQTTTQRTAKSKRQQQPPPTTTTTTTTTNNNNNYRTNNQQTNKISFWRFMPLHFILVYNIFK